jgi:hypothetical protein
MASQRRGHILVSPIFNIYNLDATRQEILNWIFSSDFEIKHRAVKAKRVKNSGTWFLNHPDFQSWASGTSTEMLFCSGKGEVPVSKLNCMCTADSSISRRRKNFHYVLSDPNPPANMIVKFSCH